MLCRRLNKILHIQSLLIRHSQIRTFGILKSKCLWRNSVFGTLKPDPMSSYKLKLILRGFTVTRLWNACFRTQLVSTVVRRCRRDRVRVWSCLRQTLLRPSRTLLLSVAAYNGDDDDEDDEELGPAPCSQDISDEDLEALIHDFEGVDELSRTTLFCEGCQRRLVIDKKHPGVVYCGRHVSNSSGVQSDIAARSLILKKNSRRGRNMSPIVPINTCSNSQPPPLSEDGWVPYMEADDVIIWRKEYKPGGLFAYKVYGRYKDLKASDFAMIQVDGAYRRSWDDAVAALSIVEKEANGLRSQTVLHWEVLWPRLFANRDYVYLRRHKEFDVKSKCLAHMEAIFSGGELEECERPQERPSVHSRAKLKAMEMERRERRGGTRGSKEQTNKVYVIVSRSCTHPEVPETKHAIRVQEYWSHMVVRTMDGPDSVGMEFVLTYYDEPSVGGLPSGVSAWATGRAAPSYLARMHRAAHHYAAWRAARRHEEPDFEPFDSEQAGPRAVEHKSPCKLPAVPLALDEQDMESSKQGPELDSGYEPRDKGTQTDTQDKPRRDVGVDPITKHAETIPNVNNIKVINKVKAESDAKVTDKVKSDEAKVTDKVKPSDKVKVTDEVTVTEKVETSDESKVTEKVEAENVNDKVKSKELESKEGTESESKEDQSDESDGEKKSSWWRYLYPFYYFV